MIPVRHRVAAPGKAAVWRIEQADRQTRS